MSCFGVHTVIITLALLCAATLTKYTPLLTCYTRRPCVALWICSLLSTKLQSQMVAYSNQHLYDALQALHGSLDLQSTQHQTLITQMEATEQELAWLQGELHQQQEYARAAFSDSDHVQYCEEQLQVCVCV